ncbi:unnamed protein product [Moneuplotes crassus]|uniref:Signal peptidase complex subunit 1 n=1 Tax=Euplotes crassus TaxID=5936 RepID=A0AAD1Y6W9_EUPCR|nr:unnamed protein product [Moneuplotes crassus]
MEEFLQTQYRKIDEIDFEGQKKVDFLFRTILITATVIAAIIGYVLQDMTIATYIVLGAAGIAFLVTGFAWSPYKSHQLKFLDPISDDK